MSGGEKVIVDGVMKIGPGAPVRMGGLDIGEVKGVGHDGDVEDSRIFVTMSVVTKEAARIRFHVDGPRDP